MKNNRLSFIIILMLASVSAWASNVDVQRAKALGAKFVEANFTENTSLEWVCTAVTEKGNPSYHVFNGIPDGFVIVSACNLTSPILGNSLGVSVSVPIFDQRQNRTNIQKAKLNKLSSENSSKKMIKASEGHGSF